MGFIQKIRQRYHYSLILLKQLVITDFKLRYQNSILGYLWSLLRPLFLFGVLYVIFVVILDTSGDVPYFGTYLLLGLVLWNFFIESTTGAVTMIVGKGDLMRKINFPRYVVILANSISALINLSLNFLIIALFMVLFGAEPNRFALFVPLLIFEFFVFSFAIALFLSAAFVKYRDVNFIWEVVTQILFYATPILYAFSLVVDKGGETLSKLFMLNPLAQIIQDMRYGLITNKTATPYSVFEGGWYWLLPLVFVALTIVVGFNYFRKQSKYFAENV